MDFALTPSDLSLHFMPEWLLKINNRKEKQDSYFWLLCNMMLKGMLLVIISQNIQNEHNIICCKPIIAEISKLAFGT